MSVSREEKIPIFMVNGFLESGKTEFIKFTMEQEYFQTDNNTLLFVCEEGEKEYEEEFLKKYHTHIFFIDNVSELSSDKVDKLIAEYNPERIIIEWNGTWQQDSFRVPGKCFINQYISIFDASRLDLYLKNMKPLMGPMLLNSELIICNRADNIEEDKLAAYHLSLKAMANRAEIVFEGKEGEIRGDFSISLPYDIDKESIDIEHKDFGIFYLDSMERPDRYDDKEVTFTAQVIKPMGMPVDSFVGGRKAMTCCEADIQFLGFICRYAGAQNLKNRDWVKIKATIKAEDNKQYGARGPIMYVKEVILTGPIQGFVEF